MPFSRIILLKELVLVPCDSSLNLGYEIVLDILLIPPSRPVGLLDSPRIVKLLNALPGVVSTNNNPDEPACLSLRQILRKAAHICLGLVVVVAFH